MKTKEISATFAFTKNLGNYQSMRAEASITVELEPGENEKAVFDTAFAAVKEQVAIQTGGSKL